MALPTHFLVSRQQWLKIALEGNDDWPTRAKKLKELVESHGIDLSEKVIKKKGIQATLKWKEMSGDPLQYQDGYQQCAKDIQIKI